MIKSSVFLFFSIFLLTSCASDKFTPSPVNGSTYSVNGGGSLEERFGVSLKENINAAEITNLIATFPRFTNDALNREVSVLKVHLQEYIYAYSEYNLIGKQKANRNIEKSYRKIQKLRKFLNKDEDIILNRYLTRIKTNITVLETPTLLQP